MGDCRIDDGRGVEQFIDGASGGAGEIHTNGTTMHTPTRLCCCYCHRSNRAWMRVNERSRALLMLMLRCGERHSGQYAVRSRRKSSPEQTW